MLKAAGAISRQIQIVAFTVAAVVSLFSALLVSAIVRRYEDRLTTINENLEETVAVRSRAPAPRWPPSAATS